MRQKDIQREEAFAALQHSYERACAAVDSLAREAIRCGLWEQADFGRRLSDLYLRLQQGPVRAVVMGQTSSGKSTLINALAGDIIAPESADVCSPIPVCFVKDTQAAETYITYFDRQEQGLPEKRYAHQTFLLQWHHDSGTLAQDNGTKPFVHTASETFPQAVTLIDSPGLNANAADTDKLYALFDQPSYAVPDDPDRPEMVLYVSTAGGNLSEEEMKNLKLLLDRGVDPHRIFVVHNEFCPDVENLRIEQFECADDAARNGLAESLRALLPPSTPDVFSMDTDDSLAIFDAFLGDSSGGDMSASGGDEAYAHVIPLNALFARVFYAGAYNPLDNLITGFTEKQYRQLLEARENSRQDRVIELCAAWRKANHADYQPLIHLRDVINEQALSLSETADLKAALRAVGRLGDELLERRLQQLRDEAERDRRPILECSEGLDALRSRLQSAHDGLPQRLEQWHGEYASRLKDMIQEMMQARDRKIRGIAEGIRAEASSAGTSAKRFWQGVQVSRAVTLLGKLLSGVLAASRSWLKSVFEARLESDPFFAAQKERLVQDLYLLQVQDPESGQEIFAALERVCREMIDGINVDYLGQADESAEAVRKLFEEYFQSLTALLKEDAAEIRGELSAYCRSMREKASGKEQQLADDLMKNPAFSAAASDQPEAELNWRLPEHIFEICTGIVTDLYGDMLNPIQKTDHIAQQIRECCSRLGNQDAGDGSPEPEINCSNVRDRVFQQVVCPVLASAAEEAIGTFDAGKISRQMDSLSEAVQEYADQTMKDVFLKGLDIVRVCGDALGRAMAQWADPEQDEAVKHLTRIAAAWSF